MEVHAIPLADADGRDKFILYRPLAGLAFVGNRAMADLTLALANSAESAPEKSLQARVLREAPLWGAGGPTARTRLESSIQTASETPATQATAFLQEIGFMDSDPAPPAPAGAEFRPTTAVLLLTNQCQLRCTYCYAAAGEFPRQELSVELGQAAIDYVCRTAQELGREQFEVSFHGGGEPTYAWKVLQACTAYARQKPLPAKVTLTSNGVWSPKQCEWIIGHLDGLSLSLDGDPAIQDRQRPFISGRGSAAFVMRAVAELDRHAFPYGIRLTAIAPWANLPKAVRFICEETGCQSMQVEPAFNTARGGHAQAGEAEAQAFADAFLEAFEIAAHAGRRLHYSGARLGVITPTFCIAPFAALIVNANGELVTCYEVSGPMHPLARLSIIGRIENGQVMIDAAARARLHALMAERRATCRDCFCYWSCAGDCYTRTFGQEPGQHLSHGSRCGMNRRITKELLLGGIAGGGGVWRASNRQVARPQPEAITI